MKNRFNFKIRLLGYYNFPHQTMKPEEGYIEEADELAPLLSRSLESILHNPLCDDNLKEVIQSATVFIFKDEKNKLYGYFTGTKIARITDVFYNKNYIKQVPLKYKRWFFPGQEVVLIDECKTAKSQEQPGYTEEKKSNNINPNDVSTFNWDEFNND
jgi:hypothetical protein